MQKRKIEKITSNPLHQGFLGEGHWASAIIDGSRFAETDPFILLMDDHLNLPGGPPVGGPHPHAGFETVTLVLKGNEKDWKTGSMELMTAGKGIVHTEEITSKTNMRILQLWLALPPHKRWAEPQLQQILLEDVPTYQSDQLEIRVYSGSSNGLSSPIQNHTPFTLVDFKMEAHAEAVQYIPATYRGFIIVLDGTIWIGADSVKQGQAGWFDKANATSEESEVLFNTKAESASFVLYAAQPHNTPIVQHGPFIGDSQDDILRLYKDYRQGRIPHLNSLPENRKIKYTS